MIFTLQESWRKVFQTLLQWKHQRYTEESERYKSPSINEAKNNGTPSLITKDEKCINNLVSIANTFNNFFTSLTDNVHWKIKFSNKSFRNFLSSEINDSLTITSSNTEEIYKILLPLNINNSCVPKSVLTKSLHLLQD